MEVTHGGNVFAIARETGTDWREWIDFSASINPLGMSPACSQILSLEAIPHYPDRQATPLREALAAYWNVPAERVLLGNGATDLLFRWCRQYPQGALAAPVFSEFHRAWPTARICPIDGHWPLDVPLVLTRPVNPTGHLISVDRVLQHVERSGQPVLVDESFIEFTGAPSLMRHAGGNLFVLQSLTKFWAIPGLRLGALIGDPAVLESMAIPWSVNHFAEQAGLISLADTAHAQRTREFVRTEREWLAAQLIGFGVHESTANYLYLEYPRAAELTRFALEHKLLLRDCTGWPGLPGSALRIAVRTREQNEYLLKVIQEFSCSA